MRIYNKNTLEQHCKKHTLQTRQVTKGRMQSIRQCQAILIFNFITTLSAKNTHSVTGSQHGQICIAGKSALNNEHKQEHWLNIQQNCTQEV